jgi:hypothetical protein
MRVRSRAYARVSISTGTRAGSQLARDRWRQTGELDEDVDVLRACLFYEARAYRHGEGYGPFAQEPFVAALVMLIRRISGGLVPTKGTVT